MFIKRFAFKFKIIGLIVILLNTQVVDIYANTTKNLRQKQEQINSNKKHVKENLKENKQQQVKVEEEIKKVDLNLEKVLLELDSISGQLNKTQKELKKTEEDLQQAEEKRKIQYDAFTKRAIFMYKNGKLSYFDIVFKAQNFSDLIKRIDYVTRIIEYDKNLLNDLVSTERLIKSKVTELEKKKTKLKSLQVQEKHKKASYENIRAEKSKILNTLSKEQEKYQKELYALENSSKEVEALIKAEAKKAAEAAARNKNSNSNSNKTTITTNGKLGWPVPVKSPSRSNISSDFGIRKHPITHAIKRHSGIDIPAPKLSNAVAAEAGTVIASRYMNGYGYTVIIDHGNGISTLYGHNTTNVVRVGQRVKKGDVVSKIGSTGTATGNHLHFEVRVNGVATNPKPYLGI